jgi:hypothetical protein
MYMFIHTYSLQEIIVSFRRSAPISYLAQDTVLAGYGLSDFRLFLDWSKGYFSFHRLVPTGSKAHPALTKCDISPRVSTRKMNLVSHLPMAQKLRMREAIPQLPHTSSGLVFE